MEDAKTVRYVSKDPIQNLKIRVTLWRLSVQRSKVHVNQPNAGGPGQPGQAQAQPQAQAPAGGPQPQQPVPLPLPQPTLGPDGQPLPAPGGLPPGAPSAAGAGPYPGPQPPPFQQQQAQYVDPQAQAQYAGGQPQQLPQPGPQALPQGGQAVAESFDVARPGPGPGSLLPPSAGRNSRGTRQRMSLQQQQRLNDAASEAPVMGQLAGGASGGGRGPRGWGQPGMGTTGYNPAAGPVPDPFGPWSISGNSAGPVPYGQPRRGQPLGEAIEEPGAAGGGGDEDLTGNLRRGRQRRQQVALRTAAQAVGEADSSEQQQLLRPQQQPQQQSAPPDPQQSQSLQQQQQQQQAVGALTSEQQAQQQQQPTAGAMQPQPQAGAAGAPPPHLALDNILIPPQVVPKVVPYGSLGPEARMAATGEPPEVPPTTPQNELPERFKTDRVFGWQEKVYSPGEVAAALAAAVQAAQASGGAGSPLPPPPGMAGTAGTDPAVQQQQQQQVPGAGAGQPSEQQSQQPQAQPGATGPGGQPQPGQPGPQQQSQPQAPPVKSKRYLGFGSDSALNNKQMDPRTRGSILFTYIQTDDFCVAQELGRTVTTSLYEEENMLVTKLLSNPKSRAQVLAFRSMYIVADLGGETDSDTQPNEQVLVSLRAYPDGSFDMCPGFSKQGSKYRFEDKHGGIFEYTVENASATDIPSLEKRTAKLERAVVARAEELRRAALKTDFEEPPAADCTRLVLLGEIQAAADFPRDRLYIEYVVRWDPDLWDLKTNWPQPELGIAQGVTHTSRVTVYPADPATDTPARDVAHFAHPLELEWVSKGAPAGNAYPCLFFQVCTLDGLNRYTSEGYGWLSLDGRVPGSGTHVVRTWKPLGTIRDRQAEWFVGGSAELADLAYLTTPSGFNGKILNKYGFKTESIGAIKVRIHTVTQRFNPEAEALAALRRSGGSPGALLRGAGGPGLKRNLLAAAAAGKKDLSLKMVVERARQRLREARGTDQLPGGDVGVRPGLVAEAPTIIGQPQDASVPEDSTVRFKVLARGLGPLKYEWYKDDRRLLVATADQPELVLVQVSLESEGAYHCLVSNRDGSVSSSRATLTVTRAARVSRATAGAGAESGRTPRRPQRSPSGSVTGGPTRGGARVSRLARLDAAAARSGAGGSVAGSDVGGQLSPSVTPGGGGGGGGPASLASAGPSPRESSGGTPLLGAAPAAAQPLPRDDAAGGGAEATLGGGLAAGGLRPPQPQAQAQAEDDIPEEALPPLPAPQFPVTRTASVAASGEGFPSAVAAAAASGFQRRGQRMAPSAGESSAGAASGSAGADAAAGAAAPPPPPPPAPSDAPAVVEEVVEEVEEVVAVTSGMPRQRRRMGPSNVESLPQPQRLQQAPQQQQPPQPQRRPAPPRRNNDDDDLDAEEIE